MCVPVAANYHEVGKRKAALRKICISSCTLFQESVCAGADLTVIVIVIVIIVVVVIIIIGGSSTGIRAAGMVMRYESKALLIHFNPVKGIISRCNCESLYNLPVAVNK